MRDYRWLLPGLLATVLALITSAAQAREDETASTALEPEALGVLRSMADYLTAAETFAYRYVSGFDVVQDSGIKVEFGKSARVMVGRPDRLRLESQRRDGLRSIMVFDGENLWAYAPDHHVYATTPQPGPLDESVHFVVTELRVKAQMAELISPELYETVTAGLTRALYLGETVLAGTDCHHLLMSNGYADFQLWIATGDAPLLRRVVITYREEEGQPQFRASFLDWDMSPDDADEAFTFTPPEDAERVRFYIPGPQDVLAEDAS
jgi:hypothetical protein